MKTLTASEVQIMILDTIEIFQNAAKNNPNVRMNTTIDNVAFLEFFNLYYKIKKKKKRLMMPGEFDTETMVLFYHVAPGFIICIESERCLKMWKGSIKRKNLN